MTRDNKNDINLTSETADRIIETYEKILILKGNFTIKDAVGVSVSMDIKYKEKKLSEN
jgi:hypothetical protein